MEIGRYRERDVEFRKKIQAEIIKSQENLKNIIDELYENSEFKKIKIVKKVIDELDLFSNEVVLSKMGHNRSGGSNKTPEDKEIIQRVLHFNKFISEKIENVTLSSEKIADMLIDEEEIHLNREMKKIKQYVTNARNHYKKRNDLITELK